MKRLRRMLFGGVILVAAVLGGQRAHAQTHVSVVDEQGHRVTDFEALVNTSELGCSQWNKGEQGITNGLLVLNQAKVFDLLIRAEAYANTIVRFAGKDRDDLMAGNAKVVLKRGKPIELRLQLPEGIELPDGLRPEVVFANAQLRASTMRQPSNRKQYEQQGAPVPEFGMLVKPAGPNAFNVQLADDSPPFYVAIHRPGFLQFFEVGPFTMADVKEGVLTVSVPRPARIDFEFQADGTPESLPFDRVDLDVLMKKAGTTNSYLQAATEKSGSPQHASFSLRDLAPGEYRYVIGTNSKPEYLKEHPTGVNPGRFHDIGIISLKAGHTERIETKYSLPNLNSYRGDRTALLRLRMTDGTSAAGKPLIVQYFDAHYGVIPVFTGAIPDSGELTLENLAATQAPAWPYHSYTVRSDDKLLGSFEFTGDEKTAEFEYRFPPVVGDKAPNITLIEVGTDRHVSLADQRGKVVWLEFWATWCGPCQPAMQELVAMAGERAGEWGERVALLPLSVDDNSEIVARHIKDRAWDQLPHFWAMNEKSEAGFGAAAANAFGVSGVPTAYLIGRDGRILWTGHPTANLGGQKPAEQIAAALEK